MANPPIRTFTVMPKLPERLQALQKLAYNLWWCWNHEAVALFRRIDDSLFEEVENSPVKLLGRIDQERLKSLLNDDGFLAHMDRVEQSLDAYMSASTWFLENYGDGQTDYETLVAKYRIAYFSAEFGLHESVPIYSGGLGLLAGDHLKAASDLGIPLIGVGLLYREGYFRQYLNVDGWQQERYPENDFFNLPLTPEKDADDAPVMISVPFPGREVWAKVWRIQVGRVPLYLLDTNIPENSAEDREITSRLYGGDHDMRVRQEMILGIGGIRALWALKKTPVVCHMNEGHSAFCGVERIRARMAASNLDFSVIREAVAAGTCFTTHTPVPAGNDIFAPQLIEHYLSNYFPQLKISREEFLGLGRQNPHDPNEPFCMTVLAIRLSNTSNGVSKLHGKISRKMWQGIWPSLPEVEVPITSITNGVHTHTWLSADITQLFDRYLGFQWKERSTDYGIWKRVENIPNEELWRTHERRRERLVAFARTRLKAQLLRRGAPPAEVGRAEEALDPEALTIGFARRFATYKRGTLMFRNLDRLAAILNNKDHPVQIIFAGKAHPRDHGGKELIAEIVHIGRRPEFRRRIVFLEDYDINVGRYLAQGVDVWLNNPRRPLEASGTSGMKVACNGGLNMSILDGWWVEGYLGDNGWAIGAGEEYSDLVYQDDIESRAIYDLLEQEIVPLFYNRSSDGLPRGWLRMMKRSIGTVAPSFNTARMLQEYMEKAYGPSANRFERLAAANLASAKTLARWRQGLGMTWPHIRVEKVKSNGTDPMHVGGVMQVQALVNLGSLNPQDVQVQLFHGQVDSLGQIQRPTTVPMSHNGSPESGTTWVFTGEIPCSFSGQHGFAVRVLPHHDDLANPFEPGLICWG
jgi:starch phosphorylase